MKKIKLCVLLALLTFTACQPSKQTEELVLIQIQDRNGLSETVSTPDRLAVYNQIDFLREQPYKKVLRLYRLEGKNRSIITTYHSNGSLWQMLETKEMRAFGSFREWFSNGIQRIEATVIGGDADLTAKAQDTWLFDREARVWNEQGKLIATIPYEKGALSGLSVVYYPSGTVEKETPYLFDHIEGEVREYWETGSIKSTTSYRQGLKEGASLSFWPDQTLCLEEFYEEGLLKTGRYWNPSQELLSEIKEGTGFRALFEEKRLSKLIEIRQGIAEGVIKTFDREGDLRSVYHVKNGKKQGEEIEYFSSHESAQKEKLLPKMTLHWDQDAIHGTVKTWYDNGQLQNQRELCKNKRSGSACAWYRNGSLLLLEEYEEDALLRGQYFRKNQSEPTSIVSGGNGIATIYDGDGLFLRKILYVKGKPLDPE